MTRRTDVVCVLFVVLLGFACGHLWAQISACQVSVICFNNSQWYAVCVSPLPPGASNCFGFDFTEYCDVPSDDCPPAPCPTCSAEAASPISLATGNTYVQQSDVIVPGLGGGLNLTRRWNSTPGLFSYGMFGHLWSSNFEEQIRIGDDNMIKHLRGDGRLWTYGFGGGYGSTGYTPIFLSAAPRNGGATLTYNGYILGLPSWALTSKNGETRVFTGPVGGNLISPPPSYLTSISDRNGNTTTLTYDPPGSGVLTAVADAASRHLYFSYGIVGAGGFSIPVVTSVTSDFGVSLSYQYDTSANLVKVIKPDGTFLSFEYNAAGLLTAVKDSNAKILESHTYDTLGRGLTSSRAGGVDSITVSY